MSSLVVVAGLLLSSFLADVLDYIAPEEIAPFFKAIARVLPEKGYFLCDINTLHVEYFRDLDKGLSVPKPQNYYPNDDVTKPPLVKWRGHANLLFSNWLNYFVYQQTPYKLSDIH